MKKQKLNIPFYISTNNKHMKCLEVYVHLYNKFMDGNELRILGYDEPNFKLPENCKFISMGIQGGVTEWSNDLRKYFSECEDEYFIYSTEDVFMYKQSNIKYLNCLIEFVKTNSWVGRLNLANIGEENGDTMANSRHYRSNFLRNLDGDFGSVNLYQLSNSPYTLSCQPSIWNKDYFMKYMHGNLEPWAWEASAQAKDDPFYMVIMLDGMYPLFKKEGYATDRGWEYTDAWLHLINDSKLKDEITNWK